MLGKLPDRWWPKWRKLERYFEVDGAFKPFYEVQGPEDLEERVVEIIRGSNGPGIEGFGTQELAVLERVLVGMLKYVLAERIRAEGVVWQLPVAWEDAGFTQSSTPVENLAATENPVSAKGSVLSL